MRRAFPVLFVVAMVLLLAVGVIRSFTNDTVPPPRPTEPPTPPAPIAAPAPRAAPSSHQRVFRRPDAPPRSVASDEPQAKPMAEPEAEIDAVPEPTDLLDLPVEDQQRLVDQAQEAFAALDEACGALAGPEGAPVMAAITLDERGVLELDLSAYDPDIGAVAADHPLPDALVDCVDDVLWDLDWPTREGGVRFALTAALEPPGDDALTPR